MSEGLEEGRAHAPNYVKLDISSIKNNSLERIWCRERNIIGAFSHLPLRDFNLFLGVEIQTGFTHFR